MPSKTPNPVKTICDFVLERSQDLPVPQRVSLYRALAEFCHNEKEAATLLQLADSLESADRNCREFVFFTTRK